MLPHVRLRLSDGTVRTLGHGDLVGRLATAALRVDDASISEAHALVSLRGVELHLLALRGIFAVDGVPCNDTPLRPGLHVQLSRGVSVSVEAVQLPDVVAVLEGAGPARPQLASVASLRAGDPVTVDGRYDERADAWLWAADEGWLLQRRGQDPVAVAADAPFTLGGATLCVRRVPLAEAGLDATLARGAVLAPLVVRARHDSVHLVRDGLPTVVLTGQPARIVSELAIAGVPVGWDLLADCVLQAGHLDPVDQRRRWDLARLRRKLREAGIRADLVRADGAGNFELVLGLHDRVVDET